MPSVCCHRTQANPPRQCVYLCFARPVGRVLFAVLTRGFNLYELLVFTLRCPPKPHVPRDVFMRRVDGLFNEGLCARRSLQPLWLIDPR